MYKQKKKYELLELLNQRDQEIVSLRRQRDFHLKRIEKMNMTAAQRLVDYFIRWSDDYRKRQEVLNAKEEE